MEKWMRAFAYVMVGLGGLFVLSGVTGGSVAYVVIGVVFAAYYLVWARVLSRRSERAPEPDTAAGTADQFTTSAR
jgi:hypothetical protein